MARLMEKYKAVIAPSMVADLGIPNIMAVPRLEKIVVNMGVGKATEDKNRIDAAVSDLATITGQRPVVTKAKQSVSGFKLRQGQAIGCKVTLRRKMMYEFLDRLISVVIPRIRDFRGLPKNAFDRAGNYSIGISEQLVFPEISVDKVQFVQGMDITLVVNARNQKESFEMLRRLGLPFGA